MADPKHMERRRIASPLADATLTGALVWPDLRFQAADTGVETGAGDRPLTDVTIERIDVVE